MLVAQADAGVVSLADAEVVSLANAGAASLTDAGVASLADARVTSLADLGGGVAGGVTDLAVPVRVKSGEVSLPRECVVRDRSVFGGSVYSDVRCTEMNCDWSHSLGVRGCR